MALLRSREGQGGTAAPTCNTPMGMLQVGCELFLTKNFTGCERRMQLLIYLKYVKNT